MTSSWGDKLGRDGRPYLGDGYSVPPGAGLKDYEDLIYASFVSGLDFSDAPEDVRESSGVYCLDMEVSSRDRLVKVPGIVEVSDEAPRSLVYTFEQSSLDFITELVTIDPPWLGYKGSAAYTWVNLALAATGLYGWNALNYLGNLMFSNGVSATYWRGPNAAVVTDISANIIAKTMALAFGRRFAGYYTAGGVPQSLGIRWDDTTATMAGWGGTNSGGELLLSDTGSADYIVAMRPLGFDLLAIMNRNSLWAGYRTGVARRPADFRFRFGGVGCVHERTTAVGPGGVVFLSEDGVVFYTVNDAVVISGQINAELLPLDYTRLGAYSGVYIGTGRRYLLSTPTALWVYEFAIPEIQRPARWFKRSAILDTITGFSDQAATVTWDQLVGTWDQLTNTWDAIGQPAWAAPSRSYFMKGTKLGKDDTSILTNFGVAFTPTWRTPQNSKVAVSDEIVTVGFEVVYSSTADSDMNFKTPDYNGDLVNILTKTLPSTGGVLKARTFWGLSSGVGAQVQVELVSGNAEVARIRQLVQPSGPTVSAAIP